MTAHREDVADHWSGANADLARAAARGDRAGMERALAKGADANAVSKRGMPMVLWPVQARSVEGFEALLDEGARPDAPFGDDGGIAGEMLFGLGDPAYLDLALTRGLSPDAIGSDGEPLVWKAYYADDWEGLKRLVEAGGDPDAPKRGMTGDTVLAVYAAGAFDRAVWLLEQGARADWRIETAPPGMGHRVGAQPILEDIFWKPTDAEAFPDLAAAQKRAQQIVSARGHRAPPRPKRHGG